MKLYIGLISRETTSDDIANFLQTICIADKITIIEDSVTGLDHRYAIIEIKENEKALKIIEELDNEELKGCEIKIHRARTNIKDRRDPRRGGGRRWNDSPHNAKWKKGQA